MKDPRRKEKARVRAEAYAPAPTESRLLYGVIAASVVLMAAIAAAAFYNVNLWSHLYLVSTLVILAFAAGLLVRRRQARRHRRAHRTEYENGAASGGRPHQSADETAPRRAE